MCLCAGRMALMADAQKSFGISLSLGFQKAGGVCYITFISFFWTQWQRFG